jgi:hypothetical protein
VKLNKPIFLILAFLANGSLTAGFLPFLADQAKRSNPNDPKSRPAQEPGVLAWSQATPSAAFSPRFAHSSAVFKGKMWVIGGEGSAFFNDVWSSTNGADWTQATPAAAFSVRAGHSSLVFNNLMWVIGGYDGTPKNDVWSSPDGITWNLATAAAPFPARRGHGSVVFNNRMWVIGGQDGGTTNFNDLWSSADGVTWTQATGSAAFAGRYNNACFAFNGLIWSVAGSSHNGGCCTTMNYGVWSSPDGVTWSNPLSSPLYYSPRGGLTGVVYGGSMWIVGGWDYTGAYKNDSWSSSDGATWKLENTGIPFSGRANHSSVVFNNSIWVIGGFTATVVTNDVWHFP